MATSDCNGLLADELIVLGVRAYPEPNEVLTRLNSERSMMRADAHRPKAAYLLKMKRGVPRISLQVFVGSIGRALNVGRKGTVEGPESGRGMMLQMGFVLPAV